MLQYHRMQHRLWRMGMIVVGAALLLGATEVALRVRYQLRAQRIRAALPAGITIVALGDSIVAGWPGEPTAAWPALLAQRLERSYPRRVWRVVNAGVPGDTAPLGYARFDRDVTAAGPWLVLIAFGLNDCNPARYGMDRWLEEAVPAGLRRSYLWRAVQGRTAQWGAALGVIPAPEPENGRQPIARTSPAGFVRTLDALAARTREIGARPVFLTMTPVTQVPDEPGAALSDTYNTYNAMIRQVAVDVKAPLVELTQGAPADAVDVDGIHLTAVGQAWVAEQVFTQLDRVGIWAELAEEPGDE